MVGNRNQVKVLVVVSRGLPMEWVDEIRESVPQADMVTTEDQENSIRASVPGVDAIINCPRHFFGVELLECAGPSLRWLHVGGAGCEEFIIPELVDSDITLTNGRIIQGPEVADHAMALLLALTRNLNFVLRGDVGGSIPRPIELRQKTAVVIGIGGVGTLIAERVSAFGAQVIGVDPQYKPMVSFVDEVLPPDLLIEALAQGDFVFMAAPHTERSAKMMSGPEFAAMKPSAYYISVSRGTTTDTDALTKVLSSKGIAGAGLDVTDPEPLPDNHLLRNMPNVIVTPHIAGPSDHNRSRSLELIKSNIQRFSMNQPLINVVDTKLGY